MDDDPVEWSCLDDRVKAYMKQHPECDYEDAQFALIWGIYDKDEADEPDYQD